MKRVFYSPTNAHLHASKLAAMPKAASPVSMLTLSAGNGSGVSLASAPCTSAMPNHSTAAAEKVTRVPRANTLRIARSHSKGSGRERSENPSDRP